VGKEGKRTPKEGVKKNGEYPPKWVEKAEVIGFGMVTRMRKAFKIANKREEFGKG